MISLMVCVFFVISIRHIPEVFFDFLICWFVALKDGIGRIVRTFGDKLLAFKFPPRVSQKVQGFLDYC